MVIELKKITIETNMSNRDKTHQFKMQSQHLMVNIWLKFDWGTIKIIKGIN